MIQVAIGFISIEFFVGFDIGRANKITQKIIHIRRIIGINAEGSE
jgi:hypothetical protein